MEASASALSSLIITLAEEPEARAEALGALTRRDDLQLGSPGGAWVPAVLESTDPHAAFRELEAIRGVRLVEVVFVELASLSPAAA